MRPFRLLYYLFASLLIILMISLVQWDEAKRFFEIPELWWEPITAGALTGCLGALLGIYLILNRIVFMGLAVSQAAGLGIFLAFLGGGLLGLSLEHTTWPLLAGVILSSLTAALFAMLRRRTSISQETVTGLIYVLAGGLTIMIGDRIIQGHHEIDHFLLGSAVAVLRSDLIFIFVTTFFIGILHYIFRKLFLFCSADEEFMASKGVKTRRLIGLLYLTVAIGVTVATKTLGLLPVFALLVLPAFISLKKSTNVTDAFSTALLIGVLSPPLGYYVSFLFSFPTGASMITVCGMYLILSFAEPYLFNK